MAILKRGRGAKIGKRPKKGEQGPAMDDARLDKIVDEVARAIALGMTQTDAARAAGVQPRTFESWLEKGRAGNPAYARIVDPIDNARALGQRSLADRIAKASNKDWRAAAWILERRHPQTWGKHDTLHMSAKIETAVTQMSDEEIAAELARIEGDRDMESDE
jgi:transposase